MFRAGRGWRNASHVCCDNYIVFYIIHGRVHTGGKGSNMT